ncbi:MAG: hypothetical protein CL921_08140, partial [Deltaproteobacteria bacterium]|nr:hypothetical protein [Deltaproteobacteria bacterium]
TKGEWNHFAVTYDNGALKFFINGVLAKEDDGFDLGWNRLKVGINRFGQENWKGFIDDLKVFGRTLTPAEVVEEFEGTLPAKVQNVAALNLGEQIGITWDAVEGVNTYRVYYSTSGNPTVSDNFFQVQNANATTYPGELAPGVTYYFRVAAVNNIGAGELSDATNESSTTIAEDERRNPENAEPVYGNTTVGIWYANDSITSNPNNYNPAWYNSNNFKANQFNFAARLILLDDDKIKQIGVTINGNKTTKTHNVSDMTLNGHNSVKQQIDTVDKNGGWSYFHYFVDRIDQFDRDQFARNSGNHQCVGVDFKTIAEYTACNPELFQQLKDKWVYDNGPVDGAKNTILNEIVPVRDGYYTIEVKRFKGNQHYNYSFQDRYKEFVMVTQKN